MKGPGEEKRLMEINTADPARAKEILGTKLEAIVLAGESW
jgi:hypothetical protein